jgi:hypothetical protein
VGVFLVTTAAATVTVTAVALLVITGRPGSSSDPLGAAVAQVSIGKSGIALMATRQKVIREDAATAEFSITSTPKISHVAPLSSAGGNGAPSEPVGPVVTAGTAEAIAQSLMPSYGFSVSSQWGCLFDLWQAESGWDVTAENASGAYGIPQALPGSKMASAGPDWETDATTQIKWGLGYIQSEYGTPCGAWDHEEADGWY